MSDSEDPGLRRLNSANRLTPNRGGPRQQAPESPSLIPGQVSTSLPPDFNDSPRIRALRTPPETALVNMDSSGKRPSNLQRTVNALRATLPIVQRLLPLLDGTLDTAVSGILGPYPQMAPPPNPSNLGSIEDDVADLRTQHRDLRNRILEQLASLKRVEDQLEAVRETTEQNAHQHQELLEDMERIRKRVNKIALLALTILAASLLLNVGLCLHILHLLPWL